MAFGAGGVAGTSTMGNWAFILFLILILLVLGFCFIFI
mgnify:CR=1 FL=1